MHIVLFLIVATSLVSLCTSCVIYHLADHRGGKVEKAESKGIYSVLKVNGQSYYAHPTVFSALQPRDKVEFFTIKFLKVQYAFRVVIKINTLK